MDIRCEMMLRYVSNQNWTIWLARLQQYGQLIRANTHTQSKNIQGIFFMDFLPCKSQPGLTHRTSHGYWLISVDTFPLTKWSRSKTVSLGSLVQFLWAYMLRALNDPSKSHGPIQVPSRDPDRRDRRTGHERRPEAPALGRAPEHCTWATCDQASRTQQNTT